jgi:hypothetical protein
MNEFRNTNPRQGGQISLSGLDRLTELAAIAASPYSSGPGYYGITGQCVGSQEDYNPTSGFTATFINSWNPAAYPSFTQVACSNLIVDGTFGFVFTSDGQGSLTLNITPAGIDVGGVLYANTVVQYADSLRFIPDVIFEQTILVADGVIASSWAYCDPVTQFPIPAPSVTGSRSTETAAVLASLLTALATAGFITDLTTS